MRTIHPKTKRTKRTIKFRGKPIGGGQFIYGNLSYREEDGREYYAIQEQNFEGREYEVDPQTVGQFTGLFDKNDKEIYEGDIVKSISGSLDVVSYDEIAFNLMTAYAAAPNGTCVSFFGKNNPLKGIEIIGNLHDNPELLKTE